jgi:hypothetical protein
MSVAADGPAHPNQFLESSIGILSSAESCCDACCQTVLSAGYRGFEVLDRLGDRFGTGVLFGLSHQKRWDGTINHER